MKTIKIKAKTRTGWITRDGEHFATIADVLFWTKKPHACEGDFWYNGGDVILRLSPEKWEKRYGNLPPYGSCQKVRIQVPTEDIES